MKCSKCSHRSNTIGAMAKHYRKKHPGAMKRRKVRNLTEAFHASKRSKSRRHSPTSSSPDVSTSESGGTITITIRR